MDAQRFEKLLVAWEEDSATPQELAELKQQLATDPQARQRLVEAGVLQNVIESHASAWKTQESTPAVIGSGGLKSPAFGWLQWRPLMAAAAGIAVGLFSASLVFGVPSFKGRVEILRDSFESNAQPVVDGQQPSVPGHWGGDFTEVCGPQGRIKPAEGSHMLRFLRADYEGHLLPQSMSSDSFRLLDLRPYKSTFANGTAVVRLSALFNGDIGVADGPFACVLKLYALDAEFIEERQAGTFTGSIRERMLANSSSTRVPLDTDPATWQRAGNELRLPPGTDYLMIQVGMSNDSKDSRQRKDAFPAHFADRVQVVLAHLPEVSVP